MTKGAGTTSLYHILNSPYLKNRLRHGSYWLWEKELQKQFNCIPKKLNIDKIIESQKEKKHQRCCEIRKRSPHVRSRYVVNLHNADGTIKATYENVDKAAIALNVAKSTIKRILGGIPVGKKYHDWHLKYGEKVRQLVIPKTPKIVAPVMIEYPIHNAAPKTNHITKINETIDWYIGGKLFRSFDSVLEAAEHFNVFTSTIRRAAIGKPTAFKYNLKYSKKKE